MPSLPLGQARQRIVQSLIPLSPETVSLDRALGRLPVQSIKSTLPKPSFDQSTRDGYAVGEPEKSTTQHVVFVLVAEVAAGSSAAVSVRPGEAVRIMTGAQVPAGCGRVVPFEVCREEHGRVLIPLQALSESNTFIRRRGQDLPAGRVIAGKGKRLSADHLLLLAENKQISAEVYRRPGVVVLCTGSELVYPGQEMRQGQKISGNGVLLQALLQESGSKVLRVRTVSDGVADIIAALEKMLGLQPDMILTTGGMGPGKFDLLEQVFTRLGGEILYNSLQVRPGKSTLYGKLSGVPFFGLPGPPPAVRLLFHELVAPGLGRLQGYRHPLGSLVKARLLEPIASGKSNHLSLKGGVVVVRKSTLCVRPAGRLDGMNAILHLSSRQSSFPAGATASIRLLSACSHTF
ncbi:MAG: molybdopterin molybdotransferase MoeA [Desulfobulbaceae bacterium]|nr:molybdopterin molybdotransferase MoeA [Desulfobulbaceae bacterium]